MGGGGDCEMPERGCGLLKVGSNITKRNFDSYDIGYKDRFHLCNPKTVDLYKRRVNNTVVAS